MAERLGVVSDITAPPQGTNRPWTAKVGGRKVRFWGTAFESEDPSAALVMLRDAENRGKAVRVEGEEESRSGPKGSYTSFTASQVYIVDGVTAASAPQNGSSHPSTFQDSNRDRSIIAQVAYKTAAVLVASGAIPPEALSAHAGYIFYGVIELAEGKATGSGAGAEEAQS